MKNEIRLKAVIFYSVLLFAALIAADIFLNPSGFINVSNLYKYIDKISISQEIAPERLYISVWRTVKNEYADKTMNNQDWMRWRNKYLKYIKTMEDADIAINTMLLSLNDPYTKFLKPDLYDKQESILESKVTGIGVIINYTKHGLVINNVIGNSPAEKGRLKKGDIVLSINGQNVSDTSIDDIITSKDYLKNEIVRIKIKRDNKILEKRIKKIKIPIKTTNYRIINNIAIVTVSSVMGDNTINDFSNILKKINNTDAMILDLRNNYGGVLANAVEMADMLLNDKEIVSIETSSEKKYSIYSDKKEKSFTKPIVILVNKYTASAAEILAGCLKDNLNAVIMGERTYGKNTIQQVIPMHNHTGVVVTCGKYILPSGRDIHNTGITPDIYIPDGKFKNKDIIKKAIQTAQEMVKKNK